MDPTVIVVDTNFVVDQLDIVQQLVQAGPQCGHVVLVPQMVLQELDKLKTRGGDLAVKARAANDRLFEILANRHPGLAGQKDDQCLRTNLSGDDAILDCARFFDQLGYLVILLSNDRNICSRALINGLRSVTWRPGVAAKDIIAKIGQEATLVRNNRQAQTFVQPIPSHQQPLQAMQAVQPTQAQAVQAPQPMAKFDVDMQDDVEVPGLVFLPLKDFPDVGSIERAIKSTLLANSRNLVLLCHRAELGPTQLEALESPDLTLKVLAEFCANNLAQTLPQPISSALINHEYPLHPRDKEEFRLFILFWGSFCISILDVYPVRDMCNEIHFAYERFYARPGQQIQAPRWIDDVDLELGKAATSAYAGTLPSRHAYS